MTQTFTPSIDFTDFPRQKETETNKRLPNSDEPSDMVIQNILNYSRNLEVKPSTTIRQVEWLNS